MATELERDVRRIARLLTARRRLRLPDPNESVIRAVMNDHELRVGLFRFAEAFPGMTGPADVLSHLEGYLGGPSIPWWVRKPVEVLSALPGGDRLAAAASRRGIGLMAKQFIGGRTGGDAVPVVERLWQRGIGVVVDALGEKTVTSGEADAYARRVDEMVVALGESAGRWPNRPILEHDHLGPLPRLSVSIKPTALSPKYQPLTHGLGVDEAARRLEPILDHALEHGVQIWFDMEQYAAKTLTHDLFRRVADRHPDAELGIVVQAYLRNSAADLAAVTHWARRRNRPVGVRLVKGAYWDYETVVAVANGWPVPVFERKIETDANYEECSRLMISNADVVRPAFASHNIRSLAHGLALVRAAGISQAAPEVQTLYGMGDELAANAVRAGYRARVYLPIGELVPGMSYLVRRLLENTSNESFIRKSRARGADLDRLLDPPVLDFAEVTV